MCIFSTYRLPLSRPLELLQTSSPLSHFLEERDSFHSPKDEEHHLNGKRLRDSNHDKSD